MPIDVDAEVLTNTRLSAAYNIVALAAPEIASMVEPGQFVMVKPAPGYDPLLRRPFSVFEVLRDAGGAPTGISLLNKQVGIGSRLIYALRPGDRIACLGRPFTPVDSSAQAWMVAGGVGLAAFGTLGHALGRRSTPMTLFYGARTEGELFCLDIFETLGTRLVLTTEDGSRGERGVITAPLERALRDLPPATPVMIYACGPTSMLRAAARLAETYRRPSQMSLEQVMACGLGGCYSCVVPVRNGGRAGHFVRSCIEGPVFRGSDVLWEEL